jgi:hypothetical protein
LTANLLRFVASKAVPLNGVMDLSVVYSSGDAACSKEMNVGTLFSWRLHTTISTRQAQLRILIEVHVAEVLGMDVVHASHTSNVVSIPAAAGGHLKASIVIPVVHNADFRVVGRPTMTDCPRHVDASAELRR